MNLLQQNIADFVTLIVIIHFSHPSSEEKATKQRKRHNKRQYDLLNWNTHDVLSIIFQTLRKILDIAMALRRIINFPQSKLLSEGHLLEEMNEKYQMMHIMTYMSKLSE